MTESPTVPSPPSFGETLFLGLAAVFAIVAVLSFAYWVFIDGFLGYPLILGAVALSASGCCWLFSRLARG